MNDLKERIVKIDLIRGIAIILVMCGHCMPIFINRNLINHILGQNIYDIIYTFHMPIFFAVSGYIGYQKKSFNDKLSRVLVKDIISLYLPYLFLNYIYWFERFIASELFHMKLDRTVKFSLKELIQLCYIGDGITWFLMSLLLSKLLFDIMDKFVAEYMILGVFSALFWLAFFVQGRFWSYLGWGIFYCIGYLINKYSVDKVRGGGQSGLHQSYVLI